MAHIIIYVTYPDKEEAQKISEALVDSRLVACANMFAPHDSMYWWGGKVECAQEVAVIYKTTSEQFEAVETKIKALHSYDVPCIVSWAIEKGHKPYLDWVNLETR